MDLEEVATPTDDSVVDRLGNTKEATAPAETTEAYVLVENDSRLY